VALPHRFVRHQGGRDRDVERVGIAAHRDAHLQVGPHEPLGGQATVLGAEQDGDRAAQVGVGVGGGGGGGGGHTTDPPLAQPGADAAGVLLHDRHREEGAGGGAQHVGVEDVGAGIADDDGVGAGAVGHAQDGAEVAGLLHRLQHEQ